MRPIGLFLVPLAVLLATGRGVAWGQPAAAFTHGIDAGQVAATLGMHSADWFPTAVFPYSRPAAHGRFVFGLPGRLDLIADALGGASPWTLGTPEETAAFEVSGGARLTVFERGPGNGLALTLAGGLRDTPPRCGGPEDFLGCVRPWPSPTMQPLLVAMPRLEGVLLLQPPRQVPALLVRARYEAYFYTGRHLTHDETVEIESWVVFYSQLWELRLGGLVESGAHASSFFEIGVQVYTPDLPNCPRGNHYGACDLHLGLVVELGMAIGAAGKAVDPDETKGPTVDD